MKLSLIVRCGPPLFSLSGPTFNVVIESRAWFNGDAFMSVKTGDKLPETTFYQMGKNGPESVPGKKIFKGKKVVLFAVPGAFTPTCSEAHLPSFVMHADEIKSRGVDTIACVSVNDPFVMGAWGDQNRVGDIRMLSDGNAELTTALGVSLDLSARGLGIRSARYVMVVEDGVVTHFAREAPRAYEVSSAEAVLKVL